MASGKAVRRAARAPRVAEELAFRFDSRFFARKGPPGPSDWLARFRERGQSFFSYVVGSPVRPTEQRRTIVLQPLGRWPGGHRWVLEALLEFTSLFFGCPARIAVPLPLPAHGYRWEPTRGGYTLQYRTGVLLDRVLAPRLPDDALAMLGVTMVDLYPGPSWSYVFGEASLDRRLGVYSLLRYRADFQGQPDSPEARSLLLRRSIKALAHETGHMFSMEHCPFYECLMNGSNSLEELDRGPGWLCPVCLRKLHWNIGFDLLERYRGLRGFYRRFGLTDWAAWMDGRLAVLSGSDALAQAPRAR